MAKMIEAKAVISAEDRTGNTFDKIAGKLDKLGKSTKAAEQFERLSASLKGAETQLKSIDKFNFQRGVFANARDKFREAQVGVEKAAQALAAAERPTRALELAYTRAQKAVSNASRAFEEQKVAVVEAKRAMETAGTPIGRLAADQARLRTHVERTTRALHQQREIVRQSAANEFAARRTSQRGASSGEVARAVGETGAFYEAGRVAKHAIEQGSDLVHERIRMRASGMTPQEIAAAEDESSRLSKKYLPVSQSQILHLLRNTRATVGNYHEAAEVADPLLALRVVAQGAHPDKAAELNEDFDKLVKGMEIKGVTQNLPKFRHYMDNMAKAVNVFGDTLRPTDYYEMFKYGRAATNALSDDFMLSTGPTLAQELGGSSAGKALSSFHTQFVGGKMSDRAAATLDKYGFLDPTKVLRTKTGKVVGVLPGAVTVGQEYLKPGQEDPYQWTQAALAQFASRGVTDPSKVQEIIAAVASQTTTAQMLSIFATQQARIQKDKAAQVGAGGSSAAQDFMRNDPKIGAASVVTQGNNILANATAPALTQAAPMMYSFASTLAEIAGFAKDHPGLSTAATGGIFSGVLAGGAKGASMLLPWLFGSAPEGGLAGTLSSTLGTAAKWGARGSGWTTAAMIAWEAYQNRDELLRNATGHGDHPVVGDPWQQRYNEEHPADTLDRLRRERDVRDANRGAFSMPGLSPTMTYGTGIGGDKSVSVSGTVSGEGRFQVDVNAGSSLIDVVKRAEAAMRLAGTISSNGPGSSGLSSPDAAAPPPSRPTSGGGASGAW